MIQETVKLQEIDNQHTNPHLLDHIPFHNHVINHVLHLVIVMRKLVQTELHQFQDTPLFVINEEIFDFHINLP